MVWVGMLPVVYATSLHIGLTILLGVSRKGISWLFDRRFLTEWNCIEMATGNGNKKTERKEKQQKKIVELALGAILVIFIQKPAGSSIIAKTVVTYVV